MTKLNVARHRRSGTLAITGLAVLATFLDATALFVAFGDIADSFPEVGVAQLSWVLNGYTIAFAALLVPVGKLADRVGHKRTFLTGSALFTAASVACALAPSAWVLVGFRVLQAVGAAALVPSSFALVLRAFPTREVPIAVAIWGAIGAVAGALGPTLSAVLIDVASWRWVFLINLPVGLATVILGRRVLTESSDPATGLPAPSGVVLVAAAAALVSLGVVQGGTWGPTATLGSLAAGTLLLWVFVLHQRRTARPVLDLGLFRIPNFRWANASLTVFGAAFSALFLGSILFLTQVWEWSTLQAGLGVSPGPLLVAVLAPNMGRLAARVGQRPLILTGGVAFAAGGAWRVWFLGQSSDYVGDYLPSMLLTGLGVALCLPQLSSVVGQALPPDRMGVGGAASQALRHFGGTLGVAVAIATIGSPQPIADAVRLFDRLWLYLIVGGLTMAVLAVPLRTRPAHLMLPTAEPEAAVVVPR